MDDSDFSQDESTSVDTIDSPFATIEVSSTSTYCPLLELLPELRNAIFGDVLISQSAIFINAGMPEPPLLSTSKQIRREARPVFYGRNQFRLQQIGYKCQIYIHLEKRIKEVWDEYKVELKYRNRGIRIPNWTDLLEWLARMHAGEVDRGTTRISKKHDYLNQPSCR